MIGSDHSALAAIAPDLVVLTLLLVNYRVMSVQQLCLRIFTRLLAIRTSGLWQIGFQTQPNSCARR